MKRRFRAALVAGVSVAGMTTAAVPASAHPHIFAEARLDVIVGADTRVTALRHLWRFDELFTSTVLVEFDADNNQELDQSELAEVANTVHDSLADYDYFQFVTDDGEDVAMAPPEQMIADIQDGQLIILFESKPAQPLKLEGKIAFGVYDPTFYTAIEYVEDGYMAVENLPADCGRTVVRPDPDEAIAQNQDSLTEAFFDPNDPANLSKIFATRLELRCESQ